MSPVSPPPCIPSPFLPLGRIPLFPLPLSKVRVADTTGAQGAPHSAQTPPVAGLLARQRLTNSEGNDAKCFSLDGSLLIVQTERGLRPAA